MTAPAPSATPPVLPPGLPERDDPAALDGIAEGLRTAGVDVVVAYSYRRRQFRIVPRADTA